MNSMCRSISKRTKMKMKDKRTSDLSNATKEGKNEEIWTMLKCILECYSG